MSCRHTAQWRVTKSFYKEPEVVRILSDSLVRAFSKYITVLAILAAGSTTTLATAKSSPDKEDSKKAKAEEKAASDDSDAKGSESNSADEDRDEPSSEDPSEKEAPTSSVLTPEILPEKLSKILAPAMRSSDWGVKVMVAETGQTLFESQSDDLFIPASNRKLFTGALALDQLGPDFVFQTFLYYTGSIDANGTLNGNLVIIPSGDPTFNLKMFKASSSDWVFRDWADKVKAAGIKYVKGQLLVDCSGWDMTDLTPQGWPARVLNDNYAPQTSPLTINENVCSIILNPSTNGAPADVSFIPPATGYRVENDTVSGKSTSRVSARRVVNETIELKGTISSKREIGIPIDKPTLFAAANFRHHLMANKIPIQGNISLVTAPGVIPARSSANTIAVVQSPKLLDVLSYMMKHSDNHFAEQVYVAVSHFKLGKGSYSNSRRLEADLLRRAQIDPATFQAFDGCGLSEADKVTPTQVCKLLNYMLSHPTGPQYYETMAISGRDGTLRNRMSGIAGRVHAKTGTINGVKTLSGYLTLASNKTLTFSFLVNKIKGGYVSGIQDRLCSTLAMLVL